MTRSLEIIINGIACFVPNRNGAGYRLLFPDGRTPPDKSYTIPRHDLVVWVRPSDEVPLARWQWTSDANDYTLGDPVPMSMSINGLNATTFDDSKLIGELPNLKDSDPNFTLDQNPTIWGEINIDFGTLSAHEMAKGSILTQWIVEAEDAATVRLNFGNNFLELTPGTTQVVLANTAADDTGQHDSDFLLYRHLATAKTGALAVKPPKTAPVKGGVTIGRLRSAFSVFCPIVDCSNVFLI
jgi:hypothetical protein